MQPEKVVRKVIATIETHDLDKAASFFSDTCIIRDTTMPQSLNKGMFFAQMQMILAAFPDWKYDILRVETDGQQVIVDVIAQATHSSPLQLPGRPSIPPSNKRVGVPDRFIFTVACDQIDTLTIDSPKGGGAASMLAQLGIIIPPANP